MEAPRGFFKSRRPVHYPRSAGGYIGGLIEYQNLTSVISILLSRRMAKLHELDTVYSVKDAYDMLEVIMIDDYNKGVVDADNNR